MIIHPKLPDWQARLDAWVAYMHVTPFRWGAHDCGLNAASAVEAQIGIDFAADMRGRYIDRDTGLALLIEKGFNNHADFAASVLPEIAPAFARIGDIAAVDFGRHGITLMVVAGQMLIGPMPDMAGSISRLKASRAFAVGYEPDHDITNA